MPAFKLLALLFHEYNYYKALFSLLPPHYTLNTFQNPILMPFGSIKHQEVFQEGDNKSIRYIRPKKVKGKSKLPPKRRLWFG